ELVETRSDDAPEGDRQVRCGADSTGPRELDDEERVAFGALDARRVRLARMSGESAGIALGKSIQGDEEPVVAGGPTRWRREFRTGRGQDQQRQIRAQSKPIEEADDLSLGPMEIVDPEDEWTKTGQGRKVAPPSILDLVQPLCGRQRRYLLRDDQADAVCEGSKHAMALERIGKQRNQVFGESVRR